jgi:hypothetical protein
MRDGHHQRGAGRQAVDHQQVARLAATSITPTIIAMSKPPNAASTSTDR